MSTYKCARCSYKCKQLNDMKKHLNIQIKCIGNYNSYKLNDEDIYKLSLEKIKKEKIKKEKKYNCVNCNKNFSTSSNLTKHTKLNNCMKSTIIDTSDDIKNSPSNPINLIIDNSVNIDNSVINNITNINITNIISFDDLWNTSHIDDCKKLMLLLTNNKFTTTLKNILENEVNLNVLLDKNSDKALVYKDKILQSMNIKEIVDSTMKKLIHQLKIFENDIVDPNILNIDTKIIDYNMDCIDKKYEDFKKNKFIQDKLKVYIKDIYNTKRDDTMKNYDNNGF